MKLSKRKGFIFLFFILSISFVQKQAVQGHITLNIEGKIIQSVTRSWENISLKYQDHYHTPEEAIEEFEQIATTASEIVDLSVLGYSVEGRPIHLLKITNEQNIVPKAGVLVIAQHHAREQISLEAAIRFMYRLVNSYGINTKLTEYVDTEEIFVIPTLNPDGLHYVVGNSTMEGNPWLRKNLQPFDDDGDGLINEDTPDDANEDGIISGFDVFLKHPGSESEFLYTYYEGEDDDEDGLFNEDPLGGVDLNRNYDYRWNDSSLDSGSGSNTTGETFPGMSAFSEPETQIIRDFTESRSFSMAMSLHSGINATYFPWAASSNWVEPSRYYDIYDDFQDLLPSHFFNDYLSSGLRPSSSQGVSYTVAGDWGDWMYSTRGVQVPLTFEIYHKEGSENYLPDPIIDDATHEIWQFDTIREYFAPEENNIQALWEDIRPAFDYWLETTPRLELSDLEISGNNSAGEMITLKYKLKNLSTRVTTVDRLYTLDANYSPITNIDGPTDFGELLEKNTESYTLKLTLEAAIKTGENLTIYVGNDFVGYYPIVVEGISEGSSYSTEDTSLDLIGVLLAVPILLLVKKRRKERENRLG
jgi:hypothetical protein